MKKEVFEHSIIQAGLRKCQQLAYQAARDHYARPRAERSTLVQLPTGSGKTALIAVTPFAIAQKKVLVLTPNLKLAKDIAKELDCIQNKEGNVYKKLGLLSSDDLSKIELYVLRLESSASANDIDEHQIIVANYHQLQDVQSWFAGKQDEVDLIIIDEAHHQAASTYQQVLDFFPAARVLGLTATPFRSDGRAIEGKRIYKYSFREAVEDKIIRNIRVANVAPESVKLQFADQDAKAYTLEQMLKLKEDAWFNRGIALSQDCCDSIANKAKEKLDQLRADYPSESHQIIASAISKRHARENVKTAFDKLGLRVGLVSSDEVDAKTNDDTFRKLSQGKLDVIVHIGMLGEGFDHPPLGVAAIFRPYKTLNPYIQFIGRVIRRNGVTPHSYIVSHLGLNQLKRFEEFKLFDADDQEFLKDLLAAPEAGAGEEQSFVEDGQGGARTGIETPVITEVGSKQHEFTTQFAPDATKRLEDAVARFEGLGADGKEAFLRRLGIDPKSVNVVTGERDTRLRPVDRRKASQSLLNEREKSIATDVIKELGLKHKGRNFNPLFDNFVWIKRHVSKALNKRMKFKKGERKNVTNSQFEEMDEAGILVAIAKEAETYFRARLK